MKSTGLTLPSEHQPPRELEMTIESRASEELSKVPPSIALHLHPIVRAVSTQALPAHDQILLWRGEKRMVLSFQVGCCCLTTLTVTFFAIFGLLQHSSAST